MSQATIKVLKDESGNQIIPKTLYDAVYSDSTCTTELRSDIAGIKLSVNELDQTISYLQSTDEDLISDLNTAKSDIATLTSRIDRGASGTIGSIHACWNLMHYNSNGEITEDKSVNSIGYITMDIAVERFKQIVEDNDGYYTPYMFSKAKYRDCTGDWKILERVGSLEDDDFEWIVYSEEQKSLDRQSELLSEILPTLCSSTTSVMTGSNTIVDEENNIITLSQSTNAHSVMINLTTNVLENRPKAIMVKCKSLFMDNFGTDKNIIPPSIQYARHIGSQSGLVTEIIRNEFPSKSILMRGYVSSIPKGADSIYINFEEGIDVDNPSDIKIMLIK